MKPLKKNVLFNQVPGGYLELSIWVAGVRLSYRFIGYNRREALDIFWGMLKYNPKKLYN